jgi:hypothetical protein
MSAALVAWKITVNKAINRVNTPATIKIHTAMEVLYAKSLSHLFITK